MKLILIAALLVSGCATTSQLADKAFTALMPLAAETLLKLAQERGAEPDKESAVCITLDDDPEIARIQEEEQEVYALCKMGFK